MDLCAYSDKEHISTCFLACHAPTGGKFAGLRFRSCAATPSSRATPSIERRGRSQGTPERRDRGAGNGGLRRVNGKPYAVAIITESASATRATTTRSRGSMFKRSDADWSRPGLYTGSRSFVANPHAKSPMRRAAVADFDSKNERSFVQLLDAETLGESLKSDCPITYPPIHGVFRKSATEQRTASGHPPSLRLDAGPVALAFLCER